MSISRANMDLFLPDDAFYSESAARAEIIRSLAGRARVLYELATGQNPFPNEPAATRRNPNGDLGVNLSGPPWGSAILHPIAWIGGRPSTTGFQGERQVVASLGPGGTAIIGPWPIMNRRFEQLPGEGNGGSGWVPPYSRALIRFYANLNAAGTADLALSLASSDEFSPGGVKTETVTISGASSILYTTTMGTGAYFPLSSGPNKLWVGLENLDAAGGQNITITSICVAQVAKRSH